MIDILGEMYEIFIIILTIQCKVAALKKIEKFQRKNFYVMCLDKSKWKL